MAVASYLPPASLPDYSNIVYARRFGVQADGVTDDGPALRACRDYVKNLAKPAWVILPPGNIYASSAEVIGYTIGGHNYNDACIVDWPSNVRVTGQGAGVTTLQVRSANSSGFHAVQQSGLNFDHFSVDNGANPGNADGVKLVACTNAVTERLELYHGRIGLQFLGCTDCGDVGSWAHDQNWDGTNGDDCRGFSIADIAGIALTSRITLLGPRVYNGQAVDGLANPMGNGIIVLAIAGSDIDGVEIIGAEVWSLNNVGCRNQGTNGVSWIGGSARGCLEGLQINALGATPAIGTRVVGFKARLNQHHGIHLFGAQSSTLSACEAFDNGQAAANTYSGMALEDLGGVASIDNVIDGLRSGNTGAGVSQRYGFVAVNPATNTPNTIRGYDFTNNATGAALFGEHDTTDDLPGSALAPISSMYVGPGRSAVVARQFTIASGRKLTVGLGGRMRIL